MKDGYYITSDGEIVAIKSPNSYVWELRLRDKAITKLILSK